MKQHSRFLLCLFLLALFPTDAFARQKGSFVSRHPFGKTTTSLTPLVPTTTAAVSSGRRTTTPRSSKSCRHACRCPSNTGDEAARKDEKEPSSTSAPRNPATGPYKPYRQDAHAFDAILALAMGSLRGGSSGSSAQGSPLVLELRDENDPNDLVGKVRELVTRVIDNAPPQAKGLAGVVLGVGAATVATKKLAGPLRLTFSGENGEDPEEDEEDEEEERLLLMGGGGESTIAESIFNLVKGIVGVGVLSIPAGIAAFGDSPSAVMPALALIVTMGALSALGFWWITQVCAQTGAQSFQEAWSASVSPDTSWIATATVTAKTFLGCLSFSMVLADSLTALSPTDSRTMVLWAITVLVLLPLCWMKDLKSLAPFSLLGVLGMGYTALAMTGRYMSGIYTPKTPAVASMPECLQPAFGSKGWEAVFSPGSILLISMLSTAYQCHYNAPRYYKELKNNTAPRVQRVTTAGFGISVILVAVIATVGFLTFGSGTHSLVLNNYPVSDPWMSASRIAVAVSLTFTYPLAFQGLRDGILDMFGVEASHRSNFRLNVATIGILLFVTVLATFVKDLSFVMAFGGATLGNLLGFVYPALMYGNINPSARVESTLLFSLGIVLGLTGAMLAIQKL